MAYNILKMIASNFMHNFPTSP